METLSEIGNRYNTDKGTINGNAHGYTLLYDLLWSGFRKGPLNILEVGLCIGGPEIEGSSADRDVVDAPSVKMWRDYFPKATIYGADISDFSKFENDWFKFVQVDCGVPEQLERVSQLGVEFDIILDDGSHASFHQQQTMLSLFPLLKPGGTYVIEDMDWQPEEYSRTLPKVMRTDLLFQKWLNTGEAPSSEAIPASLWEPVFSKIQSLMMFERNWLREQRDLFNRQKSIGSKKPHTYRPSTRTGLRQLQRLTAVRFFGSEWFEPDREVALAIIHKA